MESVIAELLSDQDVAALQRLVGSEAFFVLADSPDIEADTNEIRCTSLGIPIDKHALVTVSARQWEDEELKHFSRLTISEEGSIPEELNPATGPMPAFFYSRGSLKRVETNREKVAAGISDDEPESLLAFHHGAGCTFAVRPSRMPNDSSVRLSFDIDTIGTWLSEFTLSRTLQ